MLKKANSTTPGISDATQQIFYESTLGSETIAQLLERLATEVSFDLLTIKVLKAVERVDGIPAKHNVILKLSTDAARMAFFRTLKKLLSAPGSKSEKTYSLLNKQFLNSLIQLKKQQTNR